MRDGVTLYSDVYRPVGDGRHPVLVSRTPYSTERFPTVYDAAVYFAQRGYVYVYQDVRGRHESDGDLGAVLQQREGRLRHDRVGGEAALVRRQGRDAGRVLSRAEPVAGRAGRAPQPRDHLSDGGLHQHLPRLDDAERRLAPVLQLRLGPRPAGVANHAEPRAAHDRRGPGDALRRGPEAPAPEHHAAARGTPCEVLRRLAGASRLRRLLEAAQRRGGVPQDLDPGPHLRRLVRHLQPGDAARLRRDEPEGSDRKGPAHEPHRDRALGTRPDAEVRRARFRSHRQRRGASSCSCGGTTTG